VYDKRFFGPVRFQARSNKAPVKKEGRLNTWPTLGGKYNHFKGHIQVPLDFLNGMLFSNFGV
jgi:hypothetical protein